MTYHWAVCIKELPFTCVNVGVIYRVNMFGLHSDIQRVVGYDGQTICELNSYYGKECFRPLTDEEYREMKGGE